MWFCVNSAACKAAISPRGPNKGGPYLAYLVPLRSQLAPTQRFLDLLLESLWLVKALEPSSLHFVSTCWPRAGAGAGGGVCSLQRSDDVTASPPAPLAKVRPPRQRHGNVLRIFRQTVSHSHDHFNILHSENFKVDRLNSKPKTVTATFSLTTFGAN